jgi:small subunit ribosomal protein S4
VPHNGCRPPKRRRSEGGRTWLVTPDPRRASRVASASTSREPRASKALDKRPYPPGEHGRTRRRGKPSASTCCSCRRSRRQVHLRRPRAPVPQPVRGQPPSRAPPARTCCAAASSASTTSCTAPAGRPPARRPASSSATASSTSTASGSTSRATACARATSSRCRDKAAQMIVVQHNLDTLDRLERRGGWLEAATAASRGHGARAAPREQIDVPVREQLIVELEVLQVIRPPSPTNDEPRGRQSHAGHSAPHRRSDRRRRTTVSGSPSARSSPASATPSATRCAARCSRRSPAPPSRRCASTTRCTSSTPSPGHRGRHRHHLEPQGRRAHLRVRRARHAALDVRGPPTSPPADIQTTADDRDPQPGPAPRHAQRQGPPGAVDLTVERGRGYLSATAIAGNRTIGVIPSTPSSRRCAA